MNTIELGIPILRGKFMFHPNALTNLEKTWNSYPFTEEHLKKFYQQKLEFDKNSSHSKGLGLLPSIGNDKHRWFRGLDLTLPNWEQAILLFPYHEKHQVGKKIGNRPNRRPFYYQGRFGGTKKAGRGHSGYRSNT
jgi:hypothetical protein